MAEITEKHVKVLQGIIREGVKKLTKAVASSLPTKGFAKGGIVKGPTPKILDREHVVPLSQARKFKIPEGASPSKTVVTVIVDAPDRKGKS